MAPRPDPGAAAGGLRWPARHGPPGWGGGGPGRPSAGSAGAAGGAAGAAGCVKETATRRGPSDGGPPEAGLAAEATVDVQSGAPPKYTIDDIREVAEGELVRGGVHWETPIPPVMTSPRTPVARAFRAAIRQAGGEPRLLRKTGTSDMNIYAGSWDCPMATYGPGDSDLDHSPNEHLDLAEYDSAIDVLIDVCERLAD